MPNKIYVSPEAAIRFRPAAAGGGGLNFDVTSLASGAAFISARADLGVGPHSPLYEWRAKLKLASPVVIGNPVELYVATSDGTTTDGNITTGNTSIVNIETRRNLMHIGSVQVEEAGSNKVIVASGLAYIFSRYFYLMLINSTDSAFTATAADHEINLFPVPDEIQ